MVQAKESVWTMKGWNPIIYKSHDFFTSSKCNNSVKKGNIELVGNYFWITEQHELLLLWVLMFHFACNHI